MSDTGIASFSTKPGALDDISSPESINSASSRWFESPLRSKAARWVIQVQEAFPTFSDVHGALAYFPNQFLDDSSAHLVTYGAEMELLRDVRRVLYARLAALPEDEEEYGRRSWYVGRTIDDLMDDPKTTMAALSEVLLTDTNDLSDDARTAALRYVSSKSAFASSADLLRLCFTSLTSELEQQAMAAARTLGDIGEPALIPQMRTAMTTARTARVMEALQHSIKEIEQAYGVDKNSP